MFIFILMNLRKFIICEINNLQKRYLSDFEVRPSTDNLREVAEANGLTISSKKENVPITELSGGVNLSDPSERRRVDALKEKILSQNGYISRIIVDSSGNVIEGQHRFESLQELNFDKAPVVRLFGIQDFIKNESEVMEALKSFPMREEHRRQIIHHIAEILSKEDNPEELKNYQPPSGFEKPWNVAVNSVLNKIKKPINEQTEEDILKISIDDLILSKKSVIGAFKNFIDGRSSKSTDMPIEIWKTENGENLVVDGNHRVVEGILKGVRQFDAIIVGEGWSDYWAVPSEENKFIPNSKQKYGGLENIISSTQLSRHQI